MAVDSTTGVIYALFYNLVHNTVTPAMGDTYNPGLGVLSKAG